MRLYGGRIIKNQVRRQVVQAQELRDAVVMDVDSTNRYCRVKIQGSNTYIKAWYPENWESTPQYLKPGNAVRISQPGGNKSRIEIMGHGYLLPTAVAGGSSTPTPATPGDAVLTYCAIHPTDPESMGAMIDPGTIRIDGVTYTLTGMVMDRSDIVMDRGDLIMDLVGDTVSFDAASATQFRYDSIVAGIDGDAHVVKGTNASSDPVMPSTPTDHVRLGWVLLYPNMTEITAGDINRLYTAPEACELRVVVEDSDLAWEDTSTTLTISIRDQYGNTIILGGSGYHVTIAWNRGNGTLSYGGISQDESASFSFYMAYLATVTYTRDGNDPGDDSPVFLIDEDVTGMSNAAYVFLYDALGALMVAS